MVKCPILGGMFLNPDCCLIHFSVLQFFFSLNEKIMFILSIIRIELIHIKHLNPGWYVLLNKAIIIFHNY